MGQIASDVTSGAASRRMLRQLSYSWESPRGRFRHNHNAIKPSRPELLCDHIVTLL